MSIETLKGTATWTIDHAHSEILFKARHLVISTVTGRFAKYDGTLTTEGDNFEKAKVQFEADIDSIDTGFAQRDAHLKGDDFFDADKYPKLHFESTSIKKTDAEHFELSGDLTIRDVTKNVKLQVEFGGINEFYGKTKAGFDISGKISRKEFGLKWNALTEAGAVVAGDEIRIVASVQMSRVE